MEGLTVNECALILAILGTTVKNKTAYPSPEDCLSYMRTGNRKFLRSENAPRLTEETHMQVSLFGL